jgi:RimJ/RimL family protein N-acetyltransferase
MDTEGDPPHLVSPRLDLEPLRAEHALEMAPLLNDPRLHAFTGGAPASVHELQERYRHQITGRSIDGSQLWFNWILRRRDDGQAVGTVQATVSQNRDGDVGEVAWVVATAFQGQGYAREAAHAMVTWLREHGVLSIWAHVHPEHAASQRVAEAVGLAPSATMVDGEVRWQSGPR